MPKEFVYAGAILAWLACAYICVAYLTPVSKDGSGQEASGCWAISLIVAMTVVVILVTAGVLRLVG